MAQGAKGTTHQDGPDTARLRPPVSVAAAAELLGVSRWTVYRMVDRGELRSIHVSQRQKILRAEIDQYIERAKRLAARHAS